MDPAVGDQLRDGDPGDLATDRVEARQDDRLGRVVDDQVDAGRLLEGADVATLAADDATLHLVRRQVDDRDGVLGGVVRGHALDGSDDDVASAVLGVLAGAPLDRAGDLDGVVLGLLADRLDQDVLGVVGRHVRHALEGSDLLAVSTGERLAGGVQLALALEQLAVALLEHVRALVELFVAGEEPALEGGQLAASGPRFLLGVPLHPQLLVLGLEDQFLLSRPGFGLDAARLGGRGLHRLRCPEAAQEESCDGSADGCHDGHRQDEQGFHIRFLPSDRSRVGRA